MMWFHKKKIASKKLAICNSAMLKFWREKWNKSDPKSWELIVWCRENGCCCGTFTLLASIAHVTFTLIRTTELIPLSIQVLWVEHWFSLLTSLCLDFLNTCLHLNNSFKYAERAFAKGLDKTIISPVKPVLVKLFESVILDDNPPSSAHCN